MKSILTSLIILLSINTTFSQNYVPFPDSNARWVNTFYNVIWTWGVPIPDIVLNHVDNYCMDNQDTIINTHTYSQLYYCNTGLYKGGLRSDSGRVYFINKDSTNENLLYDFTVDIGDTLRNIYIELWGGTGWLYDLIITQNTDSILINGTYRKQIHVVGGKWIEGVGNTQGLFLEPWPNVSNYFLELHCMSYRDTTLFPAFSPYPCPLNVNIVEQMISDSRISVYPNPVKNNLFITISNANIDSFKLLNFTGQTVLTKSNLNGNSFTLDVSHLTNGIYIAEVVSGNDVARVKLIKN